MRTSILILLCLALVLALVHVDARKKKPSKKPGKKPSKPGVKGECDVGSPKLTVANTKKYTDEGSKNLWKYFNVKELGKPRMWGEEYKYIQCPSNC